MYRIRIVGLILMAWAFPLALRAADEAPRLAEPKVVLIGIGEHADKDIKPRPHAEDDAKALYDLATSKEHVGAKPEHVKLLLGKPDEKRKSEPATRENILKATAWLASECKAGDLAIFAFIGEGGPLGEKSERRCYFASDSTFKDRGKTAVPASEIEERLQKLKSRRFAAFVDVNFKGHEAKGVLDPVLGAMPYREFLGDDNTDEHGYLPGRSLFLATNGLSASLDLKEHGLLTFVVLAGLKGAADKEGYEPDGYVTVGELASYVGKELPRLVREQGKTKEEKEQLHFVLGERGVATVLANNPAAIAKVLGRLKKLESLIDDKKLEGEMADEAKRYLEQMPPLKAQQDLRKEYQQFVDGTIDAAKLAERRTAILASIKLDKDDADKFAKRILDATDLLMEEYVKKVNQGELVGWAIRGLYRRINEKIPAALNERLSESKTLKRGELRKLLVDARNELGKREDLAGGKDVDIALQRMMANLDPYTTFIDPATLEQFKKATEGKFVGIGVSIRRDAATDQLLVITPLKGSPAYKAGIRAGDLITKIILVCDPEGKPLDKPEEVPTRGLDVSGAVKRITGKPNTTVKVEVQRPGEDKPRVFEIVRQSIEMESALGYRRKANDDWDFMVDPASKIGYIRLTQFTRELAREVSRAMGELRKLELKGLVFDVRFNPGGLLTTAFEITDTYVDDGLIVSIRPRSRSEQKMTGESEGSQTKFPMVCLVNDQSASGSEILAAALQDQGRALIVGERSYGKGSVQDVQKFGGGEIKLTTATFWRPSGRNLNKASTKGKPEEDWGVIPDKGYEVKLSAKETDDLEEAMRDADIIHPKDKPVKKAEFKDRQLEKALEYLREQVKLADKAKAARGKGEDD